MRLLIVSLLLNAIFTSGAVLAETSRSGGYATPNCRRH